MKRSRPTFVGFGALGVLLLGALLALLVPPAHAKDQAQGQAPELAQVVRHLLRIGQELGELTQNPARD